MIDPQSQADLKAEIQGIIEGDRKLMDQRRSEIRPLRDQVWRIQPRTSTSIAGYLDLPYRKPADAWHVVEFKTEPLVGEMELQAMTHGRVERHVRHYQQVAAQMLSQSVVAALCLLDVDGQVRWRELEPAG